MQTLHLGQQDLGVGVGEHLQDRITSDGNKSQRSSAEESGHRCTGLEMNQSDRGLTLADLGRKDLLKRCWAADRVSRKS